MEETRIPGIEVRWDEGSVAKAFNAQTSGYAMLLDFSGHLRLRDGLTASRGHEGSSSRRCTNFTAPSGDKSSPD